MGDSLWDEIEEKFAIKGKLVSKIFYASCINKYRIIKEGNPSSMFYFSYPFLELKNDELLSTIKVFTKNKDNTYTHISNIKYDFKSKSIEIQDIKGKTNSYKSWGGFSLFLDHASEILCDIYKCYQSIKTPDLISNSEEYKELKEKLIMLLEKYNKEFGDCEFLTLIPNPVRY